MDKGHPPYNREPEEHDEDQELDAVLERRQNYDTERWTQAMAQKRQMPSYNPHIPPRFEKVDLLLASDGVGIFVGDQYSNLAVYRVENPDPNGSFGYVGTFAAFKEQEKELSGTLVLRFDPKQLGTVARETLKLFWWDEETSHFLIVPSSEVAATGDYVWASVQRAGIYALIGINAHPLLFPVIHHLCSVMHGLPGLSLEARQKIINPICEVILCAPDWLAQAERDPELIDALLLDAGRSGLPLPDMRSGRVPGQGWPLPGGVQNICDLCIGLPYDPYLPECEIIFRLPRPTLPCPDPWESVGPANLSGCIRHVTVDSTHSDRIYCAAANGGIWVLHSVSSYPAVTWQPLTDQLERLAMDVVEVAPSNQDVLYAASNGHSIFRSNNGGASWMKLNTTSGWHVRRLLIHPADETTVYAATHTGFQISTDSGLNWTVLRAGDIRDAEFDPLDSSIIYIGVLTEGVLKSVTSGYGPWRIVLNWSQAPVGTPNEIKIALGIRNADGTMPTDANRTVAVKFGLEIYINSSGGAGAWTGRGARGMSSQLWWDNVLGVDPFDPNILLTGEQELYRSADGGVSWATVAGYYAPHEDQQSLIFDRNNRGVVYLANDGGVYRSTDSGSTWYVGPIDVDAEILARRSLISGLVTAEFYSVGVQGAIGVGNLYHSGIIAADVLSSSRWSGIEGHAWEFANIIEDPKRLGRFYVLAGGLVRRRYPGTGADDLVSFSDFLPVKHYSSLAVDMRPTSNIILVCAYPAAGTTDYVLMMTTEGDREPFNAGGVPMNRPTWTVAINCGADMMMATAFAQNRPQTAYAITASGRTFRKDNIDLPVAWAEVGQWVTAGVHEMAVSPTNFNTVYAITGSRFARSLDGGATWTEFGAGVLPVSEFNSLIGHPSRPNTVYLSMDIGVFVSNDDGQTWSPFDTGLPNADLVQLALDGHYLYATTHGRGLWRRRLC